MNLKKGKITGINKDNGTLWPLGTLWWCWFALPASSL